MDEIMVSTNLIFDRFVYGANHANFLPSSSPSTYYTVLSFIHFFA